MAMTMTRHNLRVLAVGTCMFTTASDLDFSRKRAFLTLFIPSVNLDKTVTDTQMSEKEQNLEQVRCALNGIYTLISSLTHSTGHRVLYTLLKY